MNLLSYSFLLFLLTTLFIYYIAPKKVQWILLAVANTIFYAFTGIGNLIFIFMNALVTFTSAKIVSNFNSNLKTRKKELDKDQFKTEKHKTLIKKRLILICMLFLNIGVLVYLKYINFLGHFHKIFLPLGLSYYTFQSIAYFMDVYNQKYERETNFFRYFSFISFFPQLIFGPINRYDKLGVQMREEHKFVFENIKHGVMLILYGGLKKYLVADILVGKIAALLDPNYENLPGCLILSGILMYAIYQYADFS